MNYGLQEAVRKVWIFIAVTGIFKHPGRKRKPVCRQPAIPADSWSKLGAKSPEAHYFIKE
jgi:hypothetical protein